MNRPLLLVVGGIPGAGKTTAIARATCHRGDVVVLDPDQVRQWFRARAPVWLPYRCYRPAVHLLHHARVLRAFLVSGLPGRRGAAHGPDLVVHSTATRPGRRAVLARLGRVTGHRTVLLLVDADPVHALAGQHDRDRIVPHRSFRRHCRRWQQLRAAVSTRAQTLPSAALPAGRGIAGWDEILLVGRGQAAATLSATLAGGSPQAQGRFRDRAGPREAGPTGRGAGGLRPTIASAATLTFVAVGTRARTLNTS